MTSALPPAIALVPGFFGFDHRQARTYFADRFVASLRSGLEARGFARVPVVPLSTLPIASLRRRQEELVRELTKLETATEASQRLGGPRAWHLVGHSTGGVDAALLLRDSALVDDATGTGYGNAGWGKATDLVERIRSVTSIAAPHFGSALAECPLARLFRLQPSLAALRDAAWGTIDIVRRGDLGGRIDFARSAMPGLSKTPFFIAELLFKNDLARDLRPAVLVPLLRRPVRADMKGRVFSVVTMAPRPASDHSDKLFRDMWSWTHDAPSHVTMPDPLLPSAPGLDDLSLRLETQRELTLPTIGPGDNDGVVSTQRQVLGEPIALVIGDHVDVLGRYRRVSALDDKVIDPGLLTSGAEFGDDDFFGLVGRVVDRIAKVLSSDR
jgi:pimeloyl-ACP methyl ester carboxylesterase